MQCYITVSWKGLPGPNSAAYLAYSKFYRLDFVNMAPWHVIFPGVMKLSVVAPVAEPSTIIRNDI